MSTSVRETQARLLADSRSSEPRARLAQAVSRAEFLLRVSRTVSALQNPQRSLEALGDLLLDELVDVAQVTVRTGTWQITGSGALGHRTEAVTALRADGTPDALEQVLRSAVAEEVVVPASGPRRRRVLASVLVDPELVDQADASGVEQLLVLPLTARGRCFGVLVLARSRGLGLSGANSFLEDLAERIAVGLDGGLVVAESRYTASVLRRSLAPIELPDVPGLELASFYRVAHESEDVGGDFFDVHGPVDDVSLLCGDVTGKGVEAAVAAKRIRNAVRTASMVDRSPGWVLGLVNRVLSSEADAFSERLATAACVRLRREGDELVARVANAGHPATLVLRAGGGLDEVQTEGLALGLLDGCDYPEAEVRLHAGDLLLLYTDGVTEAHGLTDLFGEERLRQTLAPLAGLPASAVVEAIAVAVSQHLGDRPHDDIAVLAAQFRPDPG